MATARCVTDALPRQAGPAPGYGAYPTADRFTHEFGAEAYRLWAGRRNAGGADRRLALYVHLPFCRDLCYYCDSNRVVTRAPAKTAVYLRYLNREIALQGALFERDPRVARMHWGGGTPTCFGGETLRVLFAAVAGRFDLDPAGDYSIEVDPRTVDAGAVAALRDIGFNRVSFGVQDFDPLGQAAVHRVQSAQRTKAAIRAARRAGFKSIGVDLVYGLPRQSAASFGATLSHVIAEHPDRVALCGYAHQPAAFAPQRRIREADLAATPEPASLLELAVERFGDAGYVRIGMDHFALPGDVLAAARRQGLLRRDFQGYAAGPDFDLVGLGISAIGAVGPTYSQNFRTLPRYYAALDRGDPPIMRGMALTADDLVRRAVIQSLLCRCAVSMESIAIGYLVDFGRYFAAELRDLEAYRASGVVEMEGRCIRITEAGLPLLGAICAIFDRYRPRDGARRAIPAWYNGGVDRPAP